ncbi:hypothetical protein [Polaribacter septentrionalilitoris]|uniref:hypothetical protein n=1 Tax=Polaribacter septentrionalilitoris TaxID=2494657 RepID=UPI001359C411|nr:hypothetical protein [Polaribacter septentrionalilitoris]
MRKIVCTLIVMTFSLSIVQAQTDNEKKERIYIKVKDGKKPDIYVDGKKFDFPIELIDESKIASMMVLKKQDAIKKYNAPNGVILIKTKGVKIAERIYLKYPKKSNIYSDKNAPMVIIDGKVSNQKTLKKLHTNDIEKIEVLKDEKAMKKYNAPNGVIVITTKKK